MEWGDNREFQSYLRSKSLPPRSPWRWRRRWRQDVYLYQPQLGLLWGRDHEGPAAERRPTSQPASQPACLPVSPSIIGRAKKIFEATFRVERNERTEL